MLTQEIIDMIDTATPYELVGILRLSATERDPNFLEAAGYAREVLNEHNRSKLANSIELLRAKRRNV